MDLPIIWIHRMLICIRPQFNFISLLALAPLLDAISIAFGNALIRRFPEEPTMNWVFYQEALGFLSGIILWMFLDLPFANLEDLKVIPIFVVVDILAMAMNYHAFRNVNAAILSPWFYVQIPAAALIGYFMFDEIPQYVNVIVPRFASLPCTSFLVEQHNQATGA